LQTLRILQLPTGGNRGQIGQIGGTAAHPGTCVLPAGLFQGEAQHPLLPHDITFFIEPGVLPGAHKIDGIFPQGYGLPLSSFHFLADIGQLYRPRSHGHGIEDRDRYFLSRGKAGRGDAGEHPLGKTDGLFQGHLVTPFLPRRSGVDQQAVSRDPSPGMEGEEIRLQIERKGGEGQLFI